MHVQEAKDFLVQQIVAEAQTEGNPLSDLERRMLYFTENEDATEDPAALNEQFEKEYDNAEYEKKISHLMSHAYRRSKRDSSEKLRLWNEAIHVLRKGDHYILVFWNQPETRKSWRSWQFQAIGVLGALGLYSLFMFLFGSKGNLRRGEPAPIERYIPTLSPSAQHTLQFLFVLIIVLTFFPKFVSKLSSLLWPLAELKSARKKSKQE